MAAKRIIQNMISQLGQSQGDRISPALGAHFADIDERTPADLLLFAQRLAPLVNYYRNDIAAPAGNWSSFFTTSDSPEEGLTLPHLALFLCFLELYRQPQEMLNRFTGRHLDFYYRDVLGLAKRPALPDKAHVLVTLKKKSGSISLTPDDTLSAGKDNSGVELVYAPTREQTIVNSAAVDSLRSLFLDPASHGIVRYAPIANSSDGVGGALPATQPKWRAFGYAGLPPAEVGFAIASPVLRMKEGTRTITVSLSLGNVPATFSQLSLKGAFKAYVTGEKGWSLIDISAVTLIEGNILRFELAVSPTEKAVIDYDPAVHGYTYTAQAPIVQFLLESSLSTVGYSDFQNLTINKASVSVEVATVSSLDLENDEGTLDAAKAFLPFGPQPTAGSTFMVGCSEALAKKLSEIKLTIKWKDAPTNFSNYYSNYSTPVSNTYFTASVAFSDAGTWNDTSTAVGLFDANNAANEHTLTFTPGSFSVSGGVSASMHLFALEQSRSFWGEVAAERYLRARPVLSSFQSTPPEARSGFITLSLDRDFLHAAYRREYATHVMQYSKGAETSLIVLNEPYTPAIQRISLSYRAHSDEVAIASASLSDFSNPDLQFFHISYFGQMPEHGYQRHQFDFLADKRVSFLPRYANEGELLVGLSNLNPGDSVSILFEVAEGSDDPDLDQEDISWSVLCDNYWRSLTSENVVLDTTNQLLTSGVITFVIPTEATRQHTILPSDRIWLRAGIKENVDAVCQVLAIAANAVEVELQSKGNDPSHLLLPLAGGKIGKFKNGVAAVQSVAQPYPSFGGAAEEGDDKFRGRVAERLRHKDRCITPWDYERVVLEQFPKIHKVKCIPHAKEGSWLAPGHVMLIVVPDLRNQNAADLLEPKVNANTISRVTSWVEARAGMQVQLQVRNPSYQRVQLDFRVKFRPGYEFNYYSEKLKQSLIAFLSPWAFDSERDISFGGKVYKSVLVDFVERQAEVDYVTDFKCLATSKVRLRTT